VIATALLILAAWSPDTTLRLPQGGTVSIEVGFRNVFLTVGDGDQVSVTGADAVLSGNRIGIESMNFMNRRGGGPLRLVVPTWARVEVSVVNGNLQVERAPASLMAEVVNGAIATQGGTGVMHLTTVTGAVSVRQFAGLELNVESLTGPVTIDGATGRIQASSVNDPVHLRNVRSSAVEVASVNGPIEWRGDFQAGGRYRFESHNGPVELHLPAAVSARLHISTYMGGFTSALAATTTGEARSESRGRDFTAVLGRGAAEVWVETFQGGIRIRQLGGT
jgi:DUF4097 and DUF4098 domain-containing protein YvlB